MKKFKTFLENDFLFKQIIENANDLVVVTTAELGGDGPRIVYVNHAFARLLGYEADELIGESPRILHGEETDQKQLDSLIENLKLNGTAHAEIANYTRSGRVVWLDMNIVPLYDNEGQLQYFASIERDLTDQKRLFAKLEHLSRIDDLTGIANRRFFEFRANELFYDFKRYDTIFSLVYIDIDHFKELNDSHGHTTGDAALKAMAKHCRKMLRKTDFIARIGGEEFAVILNHTDPESAGILAERLRSQVEALRIKTDDGPVNITISLGITCCLPADETVDDIIKRADSALYHAKQNGRNQVQFLADDQLKS